MFPLLNCFCFVLTFLHKLFLFWVYYHILEESANNRNLGAKKGYAVANGIFTLEKGSAATISFENGENVEINDCEPTKSKLKEKRSMFCTLTNNQNILIRLKDGEQRTERQFSQLFGK